MVDLDGNVISANSVSNTLGNPNLKPEVISEIELGIDLGLYDRLNFNLSLYRRQTSDLITNRALGPETGATSETTNIGEIVGEGVEIDYNLMLIKSKINKGFGWNVSGNFTADETTVTKLPEGTDNILLTQAVVGEAANYAVEGRPFGVLLGTTIEKDKNGNRIVGNNGLYIINNEVSEIGDPNADWRAALTNSFRFKGFSLSATLSYRHGGDVYSTTSAALIGRGVVDDDNPIDREANYILPGVLQDGSPNNIAITGTEIGFNSYFAGNSANETLIFDGTTLRVQEVSFGYDFSSELLEKTFLGSLSINFLGRNLWYKAFNFPDDIKFDTNSLSTGVGNGQGIDFITGPSTRSYGLSINATF